MAHSEIMKRTLLRGTEALYSDGAYYDHIYRRRRDDVRFYVEMARRHGGPVLELGAGTGRVTLALARAGFDAIGVDSHPAMLERARAEADKLPTSARARVRFRKGDLRSVRVEGRYPLVIAPFNVFMHLYERRDVERALVTCRRHLARRGRLVFDVMVPDLRALTQSPARLYKGRPVTHPRDGKRYGYMESSHYDALSQIRSIHMFLDQLEDPSVQEMIPLAHRQFFPAELDALLHYNGFTVERRYGDFALGPPAGDAESQVIVARPRRMASGRF